MFCLDFRVFHRPGLKSVEWIILLEVSPKMSATGQTVQAVLQSEGVFFNVSILHQLNEKKKGSRK